MAGNDYNTKRFLRAFLQTGGPGGANDLRFWGRDMSTFKIDGISRPRLGGVDGVFQHTPTRVGTFDQVQTMIKPPDLHSFSMTFRERKGYLPLSMTDFNCPQNVYLVAGDGCRNLSDFDNGWASYVQILPAATATKIDDGDRVDFDDDKALETKIDFTCARPIYAVGQMSFGAASITATATVFNAITYGNQPQCADCGPADDGTQKVYAVATGGVAAAPLMWYSLDGGQTWTSSSIATAANAEAPNDIIVWNGYLFVLSPTASSGTQGGYYYIPLDQTTGAPQSGATWTKVTTGFVNAKQPRDAVLVNNTIWIAGDGGYIYKVTDITQGATVNNAGATVTTNLVRIAGQDTFIIASGATSGLIYSANNGGSWSASATTPVGASTFGALAIVNRYQWWVGTTVGTVGKLYYTRDGGQTWTNKSFTGDGVGTLTDIVVATPEVIYFAHNTASPTARIFGSINGGRSFTNASPRIATLPTFNLATRLAVPINAGPLATANNLMIAGTASGGTDGTVVMGSAPVL